jgi:hypothetical protein
VDETPPADSHPEQDPGSHVSTAPGADDTTLTSQSESEAAREVTS